MLSVALAVVYVAVGVYLIQFALPWERRDKDAVLAAGGLLPVCAGLLVLLEILLEPGQLIGETPPARQV